MTFSFKKILLLVSFFLFCAGLWWGWRWYKALTANTYEDLLNALYTDSVPRLQPAEVAQRNDLLRLDTRLAEEYAVSHLPDAVFVDYKAPDWDALEQLDKTQPVLVYCSVGYRSERIGEGLLARGFQQVYNLQGGIFEWVNQGYPVADESGNTVKAIHGYAPRWGKWVTAPIQVQYD